LHPRRQCLVLAGGLGTRMRPSTEILAKSMLTAAGKPFVHYQLDWLAAEGVTDVVYSIGYRGGAIRDYVGDGSRWGIRAVFVDEGDRLLGTAGALRLAFDQGVLDPAVAVLYGDSYLRVSLSAMWQRFQESGHPALMTVLCNEGRWDRSNVIYRDGQVLLYDKHAADPLPSAMQFIDSGISILSRDLIEQVPPAERSDLAPLLNRLSLEGRLAGFEATERFYEIGSPQGLADFEQYIFSTRAETTANPPPAEPASSVEDSPALP
jgi:NDP-sugar pyrophosphorylase family protein